MKTHALYTLLAACVSASSLGCSTPDAASGSEPSSDPSVQAEVSTQGTVSIETTRKKGPKSTIGWPVPDPSSTTTASVDLSTTTVVAAMNQLKSSFYDGKTGFSKQPTASWNNDEPRQCLQACPAYYSDVVCHFYCWHPSYDQVVPNIRGCFTQIARGSFPQSNKTITDKTGATTTRQLFYPETYDYCTYQPFDAVTGTASIPKYDQATIDANKKSGTKPGVNKWVDDNEAQAFKHVMFTWYDPFLFTIESQQKALNEFYGVKLSKPDYDTTDTADVAACTAARRRTAQDGALPAGMECSTKKDLKAHQRHPQWDTIVKFMNSRDKSLK